MDERVKALYIENIKTKIIDIADGINGGEYKEYWEDHEVEYNIEGLYRLMKIYFTEVNR